MLQEKIVYILYIFCQILIEGTVGDDFNGDIAIDDLSFLNCEPYEGEWLCCNRKLLLFFHHLFVWILSVSIYIACICFLPSLTPGELPKPNTTTPAATTPAPTVEPHTCPDGEFVCGANRECVANSKVCDFRQDCSDGSDELNCGEHLLFLEFPAAPFATWSTLLSMQWRNTAILRMVKFVVGNVSTPLWSQPIHFIGQLTKARAFIMERSSSALLMTTPCEYQLNIHVAVTPTALKQ